MSEALNCTVFDFMDDRSFTRNHGNDDIEAIRALAISLAESSRNRITENLPRDAEGLNINRVESFLKKHGFDVGVFSIINEENRDSLENILKKYQLMPKLGSCNGQSITHLGWSYVLRQPELEAQNGVGYTESLLVHELGHMTGAKYITAAVPSSNSKIFMGTNIEYSRAGMVINNNARPEGLFFEEAFASLLQYKYITEELGLENGFGNIGTFEIGLNDVCVASGVPAKYLLKSANGRYEVFDIPILAAATFETLEVQCPGIIDLLFNARSDITSMRALAISLNNLEHGLYRKLRKLTYTVEDFAKGYTLVQNISTDAQSS